MDLARRIDRHTGMYCCCGLLDCCHNEEIWGEFNCGEGRRVHVHSGSPNSGYLFGWTDEQYAAWQRYLNRPDPAEYPEGSLERLVVEAELEEWRRRERELSQGV